MGNGNSAEHKVYKIPIIHPREFNQFANSFVLHGQQKLIVQEPYNQVQVGYESLSNSLMAKQNREESGIRVVHGLVGLANLGNTCYFNSALHCLLHTQPLADYFLSNLHMKELNRKNRNGTGGEVTEHLARLFIEMWSQSRSVGIDHSESSTEDRCTQKQKFREYISPMKLIRTVLQHSRIFRAGCISIIYKQIHKYIEQEDSQEALAYLLDMLHEDLNRAKPSQNTIPVNDTNKKVKEEVLAAEAWQAHLEFNKSVVVDLFQGQMKSILKCMECGHEGFKFEPYLFLSLPIPKPRQKKSIRKSVSMVEGYESREESVTLDECLQLFQATELLDVQSPCPRCMKNVDSQKQLQLWKLPNILIIHLKRFQFEKKGGKLHTSVHFPIEDLDLSSYVKSVQKETPLYTLYAVLQHEGSLSSGHYTATVLNRNDGRWYCYNDQLVMQVLMTEKFIVNNHAYVLFYQKKSNEAFFRQSISRPDRWPHIHHLEDVVMLDDEDTNQTSNESPQKQCQRLANSQGSMRFEIVRVQTKASMQKHRQISTQMVIAEENSQKSIKISDFVDYDLTNIQSSKVILNQIWKKKDGNFFELKSKRVDSYNTGPQKK